MAQENPIKPEEYSSIFWKLQDLDVAKYTLYNTDFFGIHFVGYETLAIPVSTTINCFLTLYKANQIAGAKTFIRMMFDIILNLFAEYEYDTEAIKKIYAKGYELNQVRYKGEKLKPNEVRKELCAKYPELNGIYKTYSSFIHTANFSYTLYRLPSDNAEEAIRDMKLTINVLLSLIDEIGEGYQNLLKEYGKYDEYLQNHKINEFLSSGGEVVLGWEWLNPKELFCMDYEGNWHYYPYEEEIEARYEEAPKFVRTSSNEN